MSAEDEKLLEVRQLKSLLTAEKQEFLSVMSHELRTPMTGVKGYLSMVLEGDAGEIPPQARDYLAQAYVANDHLIKLVEKMLKIARIEEKEFQFHLGKVDLVAQVQQVVNDCQVRAQEKKIALTYEPEGHYLVSGDPDRVREVVLTMVVNAIKFTHQAGKIKITHRRTPNWIITDVTDTGIGIKREDQERLFELFSKANLTLADQEHGTGAGLFLARYLAEGQDGRLWLEHSEVGLGSTFSFALKEYEGD